MEESTNFVKTDCVVLLRMNAQLCARQRYEVLIFKERAYRKER